MHVGDLLYIKRHLPLSSFYESQHHRRSRLSATGETSRAASRSSKTRLRHRCTLKPGQDFSRTNRQKTCPNGRKEAEDCHSVYRFSSVR